MRTLHRPMFNMGGPIKQGIMNGIREPHASGGRAALVGNPVYPQTGGREHHNVWKTVLGAGPKAMPHIRKAGNIFKNWMGKTGPVKRTVQKPGFTKGGERFSKDVAGNYTPITPKMGTKEITEQIFQPKGVGKYIMGSPEFKAAKWVWDGKGWIAKAAAMPFKSPVVGGYLIYKGGQWLTSDGSPATDEQVAAHTAGQHGPFDHTEKKATTKAARADFAKSQRDTRVQKYMDLMGYDRSKKTAIADALIDASKLVSDRGTLDRKNITGELINPAIQALSKRLDKPEQIREAVGLMMTKAGLEKEMYEEKNKLADQLVARKIKMEDAKLDQDNLKGDVKSIYQKTGSFTTGDDLAQLARFRDIKIDAVFPSTEIEKWKKENKKSDMDYIIEIAKIKTTAPGTYVVNNKIFIIDENRTVKQRL